MQSRTKSRTLTSAWIETNHIPTKLVGIRVALSRVRGLKQVASAIITLPKASHSHECVDLSVLNKYEPTRPKDIEYGVWGF